MEPLLERCEDWHCCRSRSQNMMTRIALEHIPGGVRGLSGWEARRDLAPSARGTLGSSW